MRLLGLLLLLLKKTQVITINKEDYVLTPYVLKPYVLKPYVLKPYVLKPYYVLKP